MEEPKKEESVEQNTDQGSTQHGGEKHTKLAKEKDDRKIFAILAYIIFFVPLLTHYKDDPYVKFHTKQGLVLFISFFVATIVNVVPILGQIVSFVLYVINIVLLVIGIVNANARQQKELPLVGKYAHHFNF